MRLLILVASLVCASGGVLHGDITGDLKPPQQQQQQQDISGYATTAGLGASASDAASEVASVSEGGSAPSGVGWVGIGREQQQSLHALENYRQEDQGLLASYLPSAQQVASVPQPPQIPQTPQVPIYKNSILANSGAQALPEPAALTVPNYQQSSVSAPASTGGSSLSGHKYTTVTFGNGLVGLGHSVDYSSIKQSQSQEQSIPQPQHQPEPEPQLQFQPQPQIPEHNNYISEFSSSSGISHSGSGYDTISYSQDTPTIPIQVSQSYGVPNKPVSISTAIPTPIEKPRPITVELPSVPSAKPSYPLTITQSVHVPQPAYEYVKVEKPAPVKVPVADYHQHNNYLHHQNVHNVPSFNNFNYHAELPLTSTSFQETSTAFHKDHYKPITTFQAHHHYPHKEHLHHFKNDHHHHDIAHHHGSNHHSSSILTGLTGGLSTKLRGGHGGGVSHHHGDGHALAANFGGDLKFANGLDAHLGHTYHGDHKFGHGFTGSLGSSHHGGYASGYSGKYLSGGDYGKYTLPSFGAFSQEKFPVKYSTGSAFSSGKYGSFPGYHGASASFGSSAASFGSSFKIPETINQQYDSNGGYKY